MKQKLLYLIGIVFLVASCQKNGKLSNNDDSLIVLDTGVPSEIVTMTPDSALLEISSGRYGWIANRLSPDGKWWYEWDIVEGPPLPMELQFTDLQNHDKHINYLITNDDNKYSVVPQFWSPDSQFLVAYESDNPGQCSTRIMLYRLDVDNEHIEPITLAPPNHGASCLDYSWAPDNSRLAVYSSINKKIFIFDPNGELTQVIPISLSENEVVVQTTLYWTPAGIAYLVSQDDKGQQYELRLLNLETYEQKVLVAGNSTYFQSVNPLGWPKVLMEEYTQLTPSDDRNWQLFVFDMETNEKTRTLDLPINRVCRIKDSSTTSYTAILIPLEEEDPYCPDGGVLWLYNWENDELFEYGEISELLGWFDNQNGFLITSQDEDLLVLRPNVNLSFPLSKR